MYTTLHSVACLIARSIAQYVKIQLVKFFLPENDNCACFRVLLQIHFILQHLKPRIRALPVHRRRPCPTAIFRQWRRAVAITWRFDKWDTGVMYYTLRGLSPRANYTDRAAAAGRQHKFCSKLRLQGYTRCRCLRLVLKFVKVKSSWNKEKLQVLQSYIQKL
jgi:hypothetical protein